MTVSTEISREYYVGNGKTTVFDYRFRIFSHEDLRVEIADTQNQLTPLTLNTDFTVLSGASEQGCKIQLKKPLAENWHITIERQLPVTQETDLRNQGHFFPEVHEDVFDKLTMLIQQVIGKWGLELRKPSWLANYFDARQQRIIRLAEPVDDQDAATKKWTQSEDHALRAKTLRVSDVDIPSLPNAAQRANKVAAFDGAGNPTVMVPVSGSAANVLLQLAAITGAGGIGTSSGKSVQEELDNISTNGVAKLSTAREINGVAFDGSANITLPFDIPVGVPLPWPTESAPTGWFICNGQPFDKKKHPLLALAYPSGVLPDLRGEFIRGFDDGRGVDTGRTIISTPNDAFQDHFHSIVTKGERTGSLVSYSEDGGTTSEGDDYLVGVGAYKTYHASRQSAFRTASETRPRNVAFNYIVRAA